MSGKISSISIPEKILPTLPRVFSIVSFKIEKITHKQNSPEYLTGILLKSSHIQNKQHKHSAHQICVSKI